MASTYSDLKIELIGTGEQVGTWGSTTNVNLGTALEEAITGSATVNFSSGDVTLNLTNTNSTQTARNLRLVLTGTSGGARQLILGSGCQINKLYLIQNNLADSVTVKNTTGNGATVAAGEKKFVFNDGVDVSDAITAAVVNLATGVTGTLPVTNGGTGVTSSTGTGSVVRAISPSLTTPTLGVATGTSFTDAVGKLRAIPQSGSAKTTSYTLQTADVGQVIQIGSGGSITIPNSTFIAGDAVVLFNNTSGNITITCSTSTTYLAGQDGDKATITLAARGLANVFFITGTLAVVAGNVT